MTAELDQAELYGDRSIRRLEHQIELQHQRHAQHLAELAVTHADSMRALQARLVMTEALLVAEREACVLETRLIAREAAEEVSMA